MTEKGDHLEESTPSQNEEKKKAELVKNWDVPTGAPFVKHEKKKRFWPEVTRVKINTKPWKPPVIVAPPKPVVEYPPLELKTWVPPYMRKRRKRPPLPRISPEEVTQKYENIKLNKVWHNFSAVMKGRMILQGTAACNSKRYSSLMCGNQTAAIAVITRAVVAERGAATLTRYDVDNLIWHGDRYHRQTLLTRKCYKGNPSLQPNQLLTTFYYGDTRYTIKLQEKETGILLRHPDEPKNTEDLMSIMQKYVGKEYEMIMSVGDRHWFVWGAPPASCGAVRTVCYIFNPFMLDSTGVPASVFGFGAFLRYAGMTAFVSDVLTYYANVARSGDSRRVALTDVTIVDREPLTRIPEAEIEIKAAHCHCEDECRTIAYNAFINSGFKGEIAANALSRTRKRVQELLKGDDSTKKTGVVPPSDQTMKMVNDQEILAQRGSDFFLYAQRPNMYMFGRDELVPFPKEHVIMHSAVEIEKSQFHSQYNQCDAEMWILSATRHMGSKRYQQYRVMQGLAVCLAAIATINTLRSRAWNEDVLDEAIDAGTQLYEESIMEAGPPAVAGQTRLILAEIKDTITIGGVEWLLKVKGIVVWGRLTSSSSLVLDLTRGLETFFKDCDAGILQLPGEVEVAIWCECSRYFMFEPMPADKKGNRVGLREGGKAFVAMFSRINRLSELFISNLPSEKRKHPFSISEVNVTPKEPLPEPVYKFKAIAPQRWIVSGSLHDKSSQFPEENRGRQASAIAVAAIAIAHLHDPSTWTPDNVDEALIRGDILYGQSVQKIAGSSTNVKKEDDREEETEEQNEEVDEGGAGEEGGRVSGAENGTNEMPLDSLLTKFRVSEYDCVETDVDKNVYWGLLTAADADETPNLRRALAGFFRDHTHGIVSARGKTIAVWRHDDHFYYFEPEACDENGALIDGIGSACLMRVKGEPSEMAAIIEANLPAGCDESFTVSAVWVAATRLNEDTGVPEPRLEQKEFSWVAAGRAALLRGARGVHAGAGTAAEKARARPTGMPLVLPAAVSFVAASAVVRPDYMTPDHIYNIIEAASDYYLQHNKDTGRTEMDENDMTEPLELGANTFTIEIGEPVQLPLRLPDPEPKMEEEEDVVDEMGEEEEKLPVEEEDNTPKEMKTAIAAMMNKPGSKALLVGDYHTLGLWCDEGGLLLAFDPAPLTRTGALVPQRIAEGEEKRKNRHEEETVVEEGDEGEEAGDESESESEIEGEGAPSVESVIPDAVSPDAAAAIGLYASPAEFIDKLVSMAPLTATMALSPYKLYPVYVTNELTHDLREQGPKKKKKRPQARISAAEGEEEEDAEAPPPPMEEEEEIGATSVEESLLGRHYKRLMRSLYVVRGCLAQDESYFLENPNRNNQDVAMAVMGIVVDHIESCAHWKPRLLDALLKYGDRLYTLSLPTAKHRPKIWACDIVPSFDVTNFEVSLEVDQDDVLGDIKSGGKGTTVLSVAQGLEKFFQKHSHGVLSAKQYAVGVWRLGPTACVLWETHAVGPAGRTTACGAAAVVVFANEKQLADCFLNNIQSVNHMGNNRFTISAVRVTWKLKSLPVPSGTSAPPACNYDLKVLTAYVELAKGRTILRGSIAPDPQKFKRDAVLQSACGAIAAAAASRAVHPALWTRRTLDGALDAAAALYCASIRALGYEFNPDEDVLLPLQVLKRFILGVNYVRFDLHCEFTGRLEHTDPKEMSVRCAIERFFEDHSLGILWSVPHAVAVWRVSDSPLYYMCEPHSCGLTGLRVDSGDDGAACILTFTSAKLMAFAYLQNVPSAARAECDFAMYSMDVSIHPIRLRGGIDPPLVRAKSPGVQPLSATSKVDVEGFRRHMDERFRHHPPGTPTCDEMRRYMEAKTKTKLKGRRNECGYLVLPDGSQFLSAQHSQACRRYSTNSRGYQWVANCLMAIGVSRVVDICKWDARTLGLILDGGDQLYKDSCLHYRPCTSHLGLAQVLRKFYTPRGCVVRAIVYETRHEGMIPVGGSKLEEEAVTEKPETAPVKEEEIKCEEDQQMDIKSEVTITGSPPPEEVVEPSEAKTVQDQLVEELAPPPPPGLYTQLNEFFREERSGILINEEGTFAVALFRTPRGFYMFDPDDRDKFGRSMPPECFGHGRSCLMQFPNVQLLAEKLEANIPCSFEMVTEETAIGRKIIEKAIPTNFSIYPVEIGTLRRLNRKELY